MLRLRELCAKKGANHERHSVRCISASEDVKLLALGRHLRKTVFVHNLKSTCIRLHFEIKLCVFVWILKCICTNLVKFCIWAISSWEDVMLSTMERRLHQSVFVHIWNVVVWILKCVCLDFQMYLTWCWHVHICVGRSYAGDLGRHLCQMNTLQNQPWPHHQNQIGNNWIIFAKRHSCCTVSKW